MPLTKNLLRKRSSTSSSKSPDGESTPSDEKLGSSVTGNGATKSSAERKSHTDGGTAFSFSPNRNHESKDTTAIDIELQDNYLKTSSNRASDLAGILNRSNTNEVPNITVTMPSEESYELQGLEYGHRLASSNRANGLRRSTNDAIINVEMPQDLKDMSSRLFNICKRGDIVRFLEEINLLYEHEKNCLYDVLLLQNEKDRDTLLHVAIKGNNVDLVKEILHILDEPYKLDSFYKDKYFEREKPLFKVISTKNKERKSVITLVIEGNDLEHIAAVFEYLACGEETKQLLIECCGEVNDTREVLADNNKKSVRAKWFLSKGKLTFALLAGFSFLATVIQVIYNAANERTSLHRATIKHTSPYNYNTSSHNVEIEYASSPGFTGDDIFKLAFSFTGLMIFFNYVSGEMLSRYRKRDSILEERLKSCVEKRDKLISELESELKDKVCTEGLGRLREELRSFRESCSTQMNPTPTQLKVPTVDSVFASPSTKISNS